MRTHDFGPSATAAEIRALTPDPRSVEDGVREIVARVRAGGDRAVCELTAEIDGAIVTPERLRVDPGALKAAEIDAVVQALRGATA